MNKKIQFIKKGKKREYAILPMDFYETLLEAWEDQEDIRMAEKVMKENDFWIPHEIIKAECDGDHSVKAWRKLKKLTLEQLSKKTNLSKAYLSQIENVPAP